MVQQKEHLALMQRARIKSPRYQKGGMVDVAIHELDAKVVEVKVIEHDRRARKS
jgi:hypothetical protein